MSEQCCCNYHLGMGPNLNCPMHGEDNRKRLLNQNNPVSALKPCPFCGSLAVYDKPSRGWGWWVRCSQCNVDMFGIDETDVQNDDAQKEAVADTWNRRQNDD